MTFVHNMFPIASVVTGHEGRSVTTCCDCLRESRREGGREEGEERRQRSACWKGGRRKERERERKLENGIMKKDSIFAK